MKTVIEARHFGDAVFVDDAERVVEILHLAAVVHLDGEHLRPRAEVNEGLIGECDDLHIGRDVIRAENVAIELPVFAYAAALGALVAEKIRYRIPTYRESEFFVTAGDESRHRRSHLRSQGHFAIAAIEEGVGLLVDHLFVLGALTLVEFGRFEHRGIVAFEAERLGCATPGVENVALDGHVLGIEIPYSLVRFGRKFFRHNSMNCKGDGHKKQRNRCL